MKRRELMARRRRITYTVLAVTVLLAIITLNNMLMDANLTSLRNAPAMDWYNGAYIEEATIESLTQREPVVAPHYEPSILELPIRVFASEVPVVAPKPVVKPVSKPVAVASTGTSVTAEEYDILLKIGMAEGAGEPIEGVRAIYTVIFNRMSSNHLGESTVKGTIFKPYQFSGVGAGQWDTPPSDKIRSALDDVLAGYRSFGPEILFYHYNAGATDRAQVNRVTVKYKIGVHEFGVINK